MSRQLDVVATFWSLQRMSRPLIDVATSVPYFCCRDLKSSQLMSRQLGVVATFFSVQLTSRPLNDVTTSLFAHDVATSE